MTETEMDHTGIQVEPKAKPVSEKIIYEALKQLWGYREFRPYQLETVRTILNQKDSLTVLPTGGGKSLCYQLPAVVRDGTAIIISPLISLMADQVDALTLLGVPAAFLNSSLNAEQVRSVKRRMFAGDLKMLYVSPERVMLDHFREEIGQIEISFFAIDEAHCISQWGHDFRPEYTRLGLLREWFPNHSIHAFTATAPPAVQEEICNHLNLREPSVFIGSYHRPNLVYSALPRKKLRDQILAALKGFEQNDVGIIYCLTRKETETLSDFLNSKGYKSLPYHAGLNPETRAMHQTLFSREKVKVMVATVAFGMGIDQSNVRFVIHSGLPRTLSHYQQESGRAGRDGLTSRCILFFGGRDIHFWKRMIDEEGVLLEQRHAQLQAMIDYAGQLKCRHKSLVEYFGQDFKEKCTACDVCLGEVESIDNARLTARKILSAVLKVRQSFGAAHVAQVLTGSKDKKILQYGHDQLSVYGILAPNSKEQVHDWINQLESQGYLTRTGEYPVMKVTQPGLELLRPDKFGKKPEQLPVFLVLTRKPKTAAAPAKAWAGHKSFDMELFEKLRNLRMQTATRLGVPAFVVFGDKTLQDMAARKPQTDAAFLEVFGVGDAKLKKFGKAFMRVVKEHEDG